MRVEYRIACLEDLKNGKWKYGIRHFVSCTDYVSILFFKIRVLQILFNGEVFVII